MSTKTLLISSVLFGLLLSVAAVQCFADASTQFKQADGYKQNKQYEQAEAIYQQIVTDFPDSNDALKAQKQLTLIYIATDRQPQSDAALQELLVNFSAHKDIAQAVHDIAYQYRLLKKYEKANQIDQYVVDNWPVSDYAVLGQMDLAKYYVDQGDAPNAESAFDKLLASFSNSPLIARAVHDVAQHYRWSGKYGKANQLYQYVIDNWPEAEHALWSQADLIKSYLALGDDPNAEDAVDKLLANFTDNPLIARVIWDTAQLYRDLKKYEKASQLYLYVIENWPKAEHAMWSQADLIKSYLALGDDPNAQAAADKLLADFNDSPLIARAVWDTAQLYRSLKKYDKANRLYQHVVENWPKPEHAMWAQADLIKSYLALGDDPNAEAAVDKLLADFNDSPLIARAVWDTARLYLGLKKYEKAGQLYQHVIDDYPQAEHAILSQIGAAKVNALSLIESGNDTAAQEAIDILIADFNDHPDLPEAVFVIGEQYYYKAFEDPNKCRKVKSQENLYKAKDIWERIAAQWPESKSIGLKHAQYFSAVCYRRLGQYEKAITYYQQVVDNWPDYQYVWSAQYLIGNCYEKLKDFGSLPESEASLKMEQAYKAVVEGYPDCAMVPTASLKLGHLNLKRGQKVEAVQYFVLFLTTARPNDPRITSVETHLEKLKGEVQ
ncbi:MAG: tetratricopeptide repeat protein [Planctomycetes bacterium]|nr:tetratricopeptide repeat protein [Planctomycetota bacterium]